jgi:hypothetical protein
VSDGNLSSFIEVAQTRQGTNIAASEYGSPSDPANIASFKASGWMDGKSGGSSVVSTFSNGVLATVNSSFSVTDGSRVDYPAIDLDLIGVAASNSSADLVWARTNIGNGDTVFGVPTPIIGYHVAVAAHNSLGNSTGQTFDDPSLNVGAGAGIIRGRERSFEWARYWPSV